MKKLLEIDKITYQVGSSGRQVRVSGFLEEGGILNVAGPSGSGKTTLLRIIARLREAAQGQVFLDGVPWTAFTPVEWRRRVHYLAQKPALFDGTVMDNLTVPFELAAVKKEMRFDEEKAAGLIRRLFGTEDILKQDARTLSGGEASRVSLIRALLTGPDVLALDEPLAAFDPKAADTVLDLIAQWVSEKPRRGVIIVSHVGNVERLPRVKVLEIEGKEGLVYE